MSSKQINESSVVYYNVPPRSSGHQSPEAAAKHAADVDRDVSGMVRVTFAGETIIDVDFVALPPPPAQPASKPLFTVGMEGVTTRDGRKVRILATDLKKRQPIVAAVEIPSGGEELTTYSDDGVYQPLGAQSRNDLIPPPPPKQYAWLFVCESEGGKRYISTTTITVQQNKPPEHFRPPRAVGCIKVELAERWDE